MQNSAKYCKMLHFEVNYHLGGDCMLVEDRLMKIKNNLKEQKSATVEELAKELDVSKDTVRRDLIKLEKQKFVRRTHGGAILLEEKASIFDYEQRASKANQVKVALGKHASSLIDENCSIIFDSSTTVENVIQHLSNKKINAVTNSLVHAMLLANLNGTTISLLPGKLHKTQLFLYGTETIEKLKQYKVDYTFLGIYALSSEGVFIHTQEEGLVKRQMVKQATTVIAIADHTKLDKTGFFKVCELAELDVLVTDRPLSKTLEEAFSQNHVTCVCLEKRSTKR